MICLFEIKYIFIYHDILNNLASNYLLTTSTIFLFSIYNLFYVLSTTVMLCCEILHACCLVTAVLRYMQDIIAAEIRSRGC